MKNGDRTIARGTIIGGFGGGTIASRAEEVRGAVPFQLEDGDRTLTALPDAKGPAQTLYSLLRSLENEGFLDITITQYGQATASTGGGSERSYTFPDDNPSEAVGYVLSEKAARVGAATTKVDNLFKSGA